MKKIIVALSLSICFIAMSVNTVSAINIKDEVDSFPKVLDVPEIPEIDIENFSTYVVMTAGPARFITDMEIIEGNEYQIDRIHDLKRISLFKSDFRTVIVTNMTFEITYIRDVPRFSRFSYATVFDNVSVDKNFSSPAIFYNIPHTVRVTNFTGIFHFLRPTLSRPFMFKLFIPAQFIFIGGADEVECIAIL